MSDEFGEFWINVSAPLAVDFRHPLRKPFLIYRDVRDSTDEESVRNELKNRNGIAKERLSHSRPRRRYLFRAISPRKMLRSTHDSGSLRERKTNHG